MGNRNDVVIDGGARDVEEIEEIEEIGFPVWSRSLVPATSVGRYVRMIDPVSSVSPPRLTRRAPDRRSRARAESGWPHHSESPWSTIASSH